MIIAIGPDHRVWKYSSTLSGEKLQELYDEDYVILRARLRRDIGCAEIDQWTGADEGVPPIGWTQVEEPS